MFNYKVTLKKMKPNTHNYEVLEYLGRKKSKGITSMEAFTELGVTRLSATIFNLKNIYNVPIQSERISYTAKNGRRVSYSKYYLAK